MKSSVGRMVAAAGLSLGLALGVPTATAEWISLDDPVLGPSSLVRDTSTGLEYLNFRVTRSLTLGQLDASLLPGGTFADFRWAERPEASSLLTSASFDCAFNECFNIAARERFFQLFGETRSFTSIFYDPEPLDPGNPAGRMIQNLRIFGVRTCGLRGGLPGQEVQCFEFNFDPAIYSRTLESSNENALNVRAAGTVPEP